MKDLINNYSLINVTHRADNRVSGYWLQNYCGVTWNEAKHRAENTNQVNGNALDIAIVEELPHTCPALHFHENLIEIV